MTRATQWLVGGALLAGALLVVPRAWSDLAAIDGLALLPVALVVVAAFAGAGLALLRALRIDAGEDAAWISVPLGAGVLGHAQLALSHVALFGRASSLVLVALGLAALALHRRALRESAWPWPSTRAASAWLAASAPFVALVVVCCAAPPSFYDALVYHVGLVEQALARSAHGLGAVVDAHDMFTAMPLASELATGTAFAIAGVPEAMGLVHALFFAVLVVGAAAVAARAFDAASAGPAAFVVASMPLPAFLTCATKPDVLSALLFLVALRAVLAAPSTAPARIDARLLGAALGLACATKLSAVPLALVLVVALLAVPRTRRALLAAPAGPASGGAAPADASSIRAARRSLVVGALAGAALACPPWLRNAIAIGNPVYPFASSTFGPDLPWLAQTAALLDADAQRARSLADVGVLVARPFFATDAFANEVVGPLALFALLAPVVVRDPRARASLGVLAALAAASLVPWLATHALPRHDPVLWLALGLCAGAVLARITHVAAAPRDLASRALPLLAVVVVAALALVHASWSLRANDALLRGPSRHLAGAEEREAFVDRALDLAPAYRAARTAGARCLFLATGEPRIAYAGVPVVPSEAYTQPAIAAVLEGARSGEEVIERVRATGATHLLVDDRAPSRLATRRWPLDAALLAEATRALPLVWHEGSARVFAVPSPLEGATCRLPSSPPSRP